MSTTILIAANQAYTETRPEVLESIRRQRKYTNTKVKILEYIRILAVLPTQVWAISICQKSAMPELLDREYVVGLIRSREWILCEKDPVTTNRRLESELSARAILRRDQDNQIIAPFQTLGLDAFDPTIRWKCVRETSRSSGKFEQQILRILSRWYQGGMGRNAVIGRWWQRQFREGIGSTALSAVEVRSGIRPPRVGRPNNMSLHSGDPSADRYVYNVSQIDIDKMRKGARKYLFAQTERTASDVWRLLLSDYYFPHLVHFNETELKEKISEVKPGSFPSLAQFRRYVFSDPNLKALLKKRYGRKYSTTLRMLHSRTEVGATGPNHVCQIDGTRYDIIIVHQVTRMPIGRAALYLMVDCFSHMIVGYHIDLLNSGVDPVSLCVLNAASPKAEFCAAFGEKIPDENWPCHHLPTSITADSELSSLRAFQLATKNNITINITPAYRPDLKGLVEALMRSVSRHARYLPGYSTGDRKRATTDPEHTAALDYKDLNMIVIRWIQMSNRRPIKNYAQTDHMRFDCVRPTPREIWKWGMTNATGNLRVIDPDVLKKSCLPNGEARITGRGLEFRQAIFEPRDSGSFPDFALMCNLARLNGSQKVRVVYHPNRIGQLWMQSQADLVSMKICGGYNLNPSMSWHDLAQDNEVNSDLIAAGKHTQEVEDALDTAGIQKVVTGGIRRTEEVRGTMSERRKQKYDKVAERQNQKDLILGRSDSPDQLHAPSEFEHFESETPDGLDDLLNQ